MSAGKHLVGDEGDSWAVGRPARDVHVSLTAEKPADHINLLTAERHDAQGHVLVLWMAGDILFIREKDHIPAIGGDMREPVVVFVGSDLFLFAAVRPHAPYLHPACAV